MRGRKKKREVELGADTSARERAYTIPDVPLDIDLSLVGIELRQRIVARLEVKGLGSDQIAKELLKSGGGWSFDSVLELQGKAGDKRDALRASYTRVLEEVQHASLIDYDAQLKETSALVMQRMQQAIRDEQDPSRVFDMGLKFLNRIGVTDIKHTKTETRHTFDQEFVTAVRHVSDVYRKSKVDFDSMSNGLSLENDDSPPDA